MKIALIGATGQVGSRILEELLRRGHAVTAIARHAEKLSGREGVTPVAADMHDKAALRGAISGHDVVISAVRFADTDAGELIDLVRASGASRYLVVGGAGSLEVAPGVKLLDTPDFPEAYKPEASAGSDFLDRLRDEKEIDWVFLSPSAVFAPGERTGTFRTGGDRLLSNDKGSSISMEDYAIAMADELEKPAHHRQRFTVGY